MKMHTLLLALCVTVVLFYTGCVESSPTTKEAVAKPIVTEESLGLRKTRLYEETSTTASKTEYTGAAPGTSTKFKRAFQDAPPMIPHSLEGLIPITINNNQCMGCHMPQMASLVNSTPIPRSHFTNFRPQTHLDSDGKIVKSGVVIKNTSSESQRHISIVNQGELVGARFNCTQCHAPQSQGNLAVENNFEADYKAKDGATRSSWKGTKLLEGIDTSKAGY